MYYHDSSGGGIRAWDYDHATGAISNERAFAQDFDLAPGQRGGPDGFTVDSEGFVWAAVWGASKVVRIDPDTAKVVATVTTPGAERSSSCSTHRPLALEFSSQAAEAMFGGGAVFGGKDLRTLYITTCSQDFGEMGGDPLPEPAGALFAVELPPEFPPGLAEPGFAG